MIYTTLRVYKIWWSCVNFTTCQVQFALASRYPRDVENKPVITCPRVLDAKKKKKCILYVQKSNNRFSWIWCWFHENIVHITWMQRNTIGFFGLSTVKTLICLVIRVVFPAAAPPARIFDHQHKSERALGNFSLVRRKRTERVGNIPLKLFPKFPLLFSSRPASFAETTDLLYIITLNG